MALPLPALSEILEPIQAVMDLRNVLLAAFRKPGTRAASGRGAGELAGMRRWRWKPSTALPGGWCRCSSPATSWMARILFTWGIISGLTAFVWNDWSFAGIRFLLGPAEAGFFPGVLIYLTWWFPSYYRARMVAYFMTARSTRISG
jgi:MFS family permease